MPRLRVSVSLVAGLVMITAPWARAADEPAATESPAQSAPIATERPPTPSRGDAMAEGLVRQLSTSEFVSRRKAKVISSGYGGPPTSRRRKG